MKELITTNELLEWLNVSPATANTWRRNGMPYEQSNKRVIRYDKKAVLKWLKDNDIKVKVDSSTIEYDMNIYNERIKFINEGAKLSRTEFVELSEDKEQSKFAEHLSDDGFNNLIKTGTLAFNHELRSCQIALICNELKYKLIKDRTDYDAHKKSHKELEDKLNDMYSDFFKFLDKLSEIEMKNSDKTIDQLPTDEDIQELIEIANIK